MEKRYQVFVSSTYADLKDERSKVIQALMEMDCIPAGMELFPAADDDQWQFIKRVIDDCDYYILIVGGRYGSLSADGISYTEKEYDYAISKGLKVLSFVHEKPDEIPVGKSDIDTVLREKLAAFRNKARENKLIKHWATANELPGLVALSLQKTIKVYPATGWVRANQVASDEVLGDINKIQKENSELRERLAQAVTVAPSADVLNLASIEDNVTVRIKYTVYESRSNRDETKEVTVTWARLFALIAPDLQEHPADSTVRQLLGSALRRVLQPGSDRSASVSHDDFLTIRVQLMALGLITAQYLKTVQGGMGFFWGLTDGGFRLMVRLRSVKTE